MSGRFEDANYDNQLPAGKSNTGKWAMADFGGFPNSPYPTTLGIFNSTGSGELRQL